jgi:hypothetical protein
VCWQWCWSSSARSYSCWSWALPLWCCFQASDFILHLGELWDRSARSLLKLRSFNCIQSLHYKMFLPVLVVFMIQSMTSLDVLWSSLQNCLTTGQHGRFCSSFPGRCRG